MNRPALLLACSTLALAACGGRATLPVEAGMGPDPVLPEPDPGLIPSVQVAEAVGWSEGQAPTAAPGLQVNAFATGLDHPRWMYVLPNGDVLVAETNAQPRENGGGLRGWIVKQMMEKAGAAVPSADRITLLRDADGDGVAEFRSAFVTGMTSPFGMALVGDTLYIANTDALVRMPYRSGQTEIRGQYEIVTPLPAGPINYHWTKSLVAHPDGQRLYVGVGSNSNVGERGLEHEAFRAAVLEIRAGSGDTREFATGLRNPVGMDWNPVTGELWVAVNERDELGGDLVPDYMTSIRDGDFFGWPWSYYGPIVDERVEPSRPDKVAAARKPDYALGAHTASLGLKFYDAELLGGDYRGGAFVGQHGSWNRKPPSGYRVIFVPFDNGRPSGMPRDILTGFLDGDEARGRPVGVAVAADGAVLVADDVGNVIWRVTPAPR